MDEKWYIIRVRSSKGDGWWPVKLSHDELKVVEMVLKAQRNGIFYDTHATVRILNDPFCATSYLEFNTSNEASEYINFLSESVY